VCEVAKFGLRDFGSPNLEHFETAGVWCLVTILTTMEVANMQLALCDVSNIIVVEIENMFDVLNNGRGIRSNRLFDGWKRPSSGMNTRDWVHMILG